jgi:hypothetical protein
MTRPFSVHVTPHYEQLFRKLLKGHPELESAQRRVHDILTTDPHNVSRSHDVTKLEAIPQGQGQYRLRLGRFRFRYDIFGTEIWLFYCGLRREETYRR